MAQSGTFQTRAASQKDAPKRLANTEHTVTIRKEPTSGLDPEKAKTEASAPFSKSETIQTSSSKDSAWQETEVRTDKDSPGVSECPASDLQENTIAEETIKQRGSPRQSSEEADQKKCLTEELDDFKDRDEGGNIIDEMGTLKREKDDSTDGDEKSKEELNLKDRVIEELRQKIVNLRQDIEDLRKEKEEKDKEMKQLSSSLEEQIIELESTFRGLPKEKRPRGAEEVAPKSNAVNRLQDLLEEAVMDKSRLEHEVNEAECNLERETERRQRLEETVNELTLRLSQEMDAKISARESTIENVNIKNRPMNIRDDYLNLCSNQWQDAKGEVDKFCDVEAVRLELLCDIIMIAYKEAEKAIECLYDRISNPHGAEMEQGDEVLRTKSLPQNLHTELTNYLKRSSDKMSFVKLEESVFEHINSKSQSEDGHWQPMSSVWTAVKDSHGIKSYISSICHLAWNMVIQRPPMKFTVDGIGEKWQGEQLQEPYWSSKDPTSEGAKVKCYVYPTLWQEDKLKTPGKVLIQKD